MSAVRSLPEEVALDVADVHVHHVPGAEAVRVVLVRAEGRPVVFVVPATEAIALAMRFYATATLAVQAKEESER